MYGWWIAYIKARCILRARPLTAPWTMNNYASAPSFSLAISTEPVHRLVFAIHTEFRLNWLGLNTDNTD